MYRHQAEQGNDDGQHQGDTEQAQQQGAARKVAAMQGPGDRNGQPQAQQHRQAGLQQAKAHHMAQITIVPERSRADPPLLQQSQQRPQPAYQ